MAEPKKKQTPFQKAQGDFERFKGPVHTYSGVKVCGHLDAGEGGVLVPCGQLQDWKKEYACGQPKDTDGPYHVTGICRGDPAHNIERFGYWSRPDPSTGPPGSFDMAVPGG